MLNPFRKKEGKHVPQEGYYERLGREYESTVYKDTLSLSIPELFSLIIKKANIEADITEENIRVIERGFLYLFLKEKIEEVCKSKKPEVQTICEGIGERFEKSKLKEDFERLISYKEGLTGIKATLPIPFRRPQELGEKLIGGITGQITLEEYENIEIVFRDNDVIEKIKDILQIKELPPSEEDKEKLELFGFVFEGSELKFRIGLKELEKLINLMYSEISKRKLKKQELINLEERLKQLKKEAHKIKAKSAGEAIEKLIERVEFCLHLIEESGAEIDEETIKKIENEIGEIKNVLEEAKKLKEGDKEGINKIKGKIVELAKNLPQSLSGVLQFLGAAGLLWFALIGVFLPLYIIEKMKKEIGQAFK